MNNTDGFERSKQNPGAVINTDNGALKAYKLKKNKDREVEILRSEVSEMKTMLAAILAKLG
jgi:hypothetical protein